MWGRRKPEPERFDSHRWDELMAAEKQAARNQMELRLMVKEIEAKARVNYLRAVYAWNGLLEPETLPDYIQTEADNVTQLVAERGEMMKRYDLMAADSFGEAP